MRLFFLVTILRIGPNYKQGRNPPPLPPKIIVIIRRRKRTVVVATAVELVRKRNECLIVQVKPVVERGTRIVWSGM
jgi:hypothetical protein